MRGVRLIKRHAPITEKLMKLIFAIETSQPCGTTYRLVFGCTLPPALVWVVLGLLRLF